MPIHDQGYRRYGGNRARTGSGWAVIARAGIRTFVAKRTFLGLLLVSWFPFFVRAVQIYLSKPLTRAEYVFGKLAILMTFLLLITWLPAIVLLIVQIAFAGNFTFFRTNAFLFPAITVFCAIEVVVVSTAMLALSSLSKSSRYVGILYAAVIFFSSAMFGVLTAVTRNSALSWISFSASLAQVGNVIFRQPLKYDTPWPVSMLILVGLVVLSAFVLERRVRGIEVVA